MAKAISEIAKQNSNIYTALLASRNKSFLDSILPTIYAVVALLLGFGIQYFFFKKTERKERRKDIGKLYGDFAFFSREYESQFTSLAYKVLDFDINARLMQHYLNKLTNEGSNDTLSKKVAQLQQENERIHKNYELEVKSFMEKKSHAMKSLHELQFLSSNLEFDNLLKKYEDVDMYNLEKDLPIDVLEGGGAAINLSTVKVDPKIKVLIALRSELLVQVKKFK